MGRFLIQVEYEATYLPIMGESGFPGLCSPLAKNFQDNMLLFQSEIDFRAKEVKRLMGLKVHRDQIRMEGLTV